MAITLPHDVIITILLFLPVKTLHRFKCTCKSWLSSIQNPHFIKTHRDLQLINQQNKKLLATPILNPEIPYQNFVGHSFSLLKSPLDDQLETDPLFSSNLPKKYINGEDVYINYMSCCHGLVFIALWDGPMILWNPSTRKHHEIPPYNHTDGLLRVDYSSLQPAYCLFHDSLVEDYKIVRLRREIKTDPAYVDMYSVNNRSWRTMGLLPSEYTFHREQDPVMFNGSIHFNSEYKQANDINLSTQIQRLLMSFCLVKEKIIKTYEPEKEISSNSIPSLPINVCVVQQKLSVSLFREWNMKGRFEVWSIMNYGENSSRTCWSRIISISYEIPGEGPLWAYSARFVVEDELLVIRASYLDEYYGYLIYDPKKQQFISLMEFQDCVMALGYLETLVSPGC